MRSRYFVSSTSRIINFPLRKFSSQNPNKSDVLRFSQPVFPLEPKMYSVPEGMSSAIPPPPKVNENIGWYDRLPTVFFVSIFFAATGFAYAYNKMLDVKSIIHKQFFTLMRNTSPEKFFSLLASAAEKEIFPIDLDRDERALPRDFNGERYPNNVGYGPEIMRSAQGLTAMIKTGVGFIEIGPICLEKTEGVASSPSDERCFFSEPTRTIVYPVNSVDEDVVDGDRSMMSVSEASQGLRKAFKVQLVDSIARHSKVWLNLLVTSRIPNSTELKSGGEVVSEMCKLIDKTVQLGDMLILSFPKSVRNESDSSNKDNNNTRGLSKEEIRKVLQYARVKADSSSRGEDAHRPAIAVRASVSNLNTSKEVDLMNTLVDAVMEEREENNNEVCLSVVSRFYEKKDDKVLLHFGGRSVYETLKSNIPHLFSRTKRVVPIIACGGVTHGGYSLEIIENGASFVQIDNAGLAYEGIGLARKIKDEMTRLMIVKAHANTASAVGYAVQKRVRDEKEKLLIQSGKFPKPNFAAD